MASKSEGYTINTGKTRLASRFKNITQTVDVTKTGIYKNTLKRKKYLRTKVKNASMYVQMYADTIKAAQLPSINNP